MLLVASPPAVDPYSSFSDSSTAHHSNRLSISRPSMSYLASVHDVIEKRLGSLEYLRKVHGENVCWLNTVHMSKHDLRTLYWDDPKYHPPLNSVHFFYLGGSISSIIEQQHLNLTDYLRNFVTLLEEYEALTGITEQSSKNKLVGVGRRLFRSRLKSADHSNGFLDSSMIVASSNPTKTRPLSQGSTSSAMLSPVSTATLASSTNVTTAINTGHNFTILNVYHLPFVPDVYETFLSLCETLVESYKHILTFLTPSQPTVNQEAYELLLKLEDKLRRHIIQPTVKDIDSLSRSLIYEETTRLDSMLIQAK